MIKMHVDANTVIQNVRDTIDLSKNFRPVMLTILGKENDPNKWTLRGSVMYSFANKVGSISGQAWAPLTKAYFERKQLEYSGKPTLVRTGELLSSLQKPGGNSVLAYTNRTMTYGTTVPYATYLHAGTRKMFPRPFMGVTKKHITAYKNLIALHIKQTSEGKKTPPVGPKP